MITTASAALTNFEERLGKKERNNNSELKKHVEKREEGGPILDSKAKEMSTTKLIQIF